MVEIRTAHYEAELVDHTPWTKSITTETAEHAIHCGIKCSNMKKTGKSCHTFRFEDGICELSELCFQSTTLTPSITVFGEIGKYIFCSEIGKCPSPFQLFEKLNASKTNH